MNVYRSRLSPQAPSPRSHYTSSIAALSPIVSYNNENGAAGDTTAIRTKASNSGEGGFSGAPVHNRSRYIISNCFHLFIALGEKPSARAKR